MKKIILSILTLLAISTSVNAQTFDWESVSYNGGFYVRQTVSGVQAECTNPSNNVEVLNGGGFAGSNANIITSTGNVSSVSVTFSTPINIQSIFAFDGNVDAAANWTFSPTGGTNSNVVRSIAASTGSTVTVNWTNVTGFTITSSSGLDRFSLDDIVFTIPVCLVTIPDANFKAYLVGNTAINTNGNTEIECSEANAFTGTIAVSALSIADLTGLEAFTNFTTLYCHSNSFTSLDVSANAALTRLDCQYNALTSLDVSNNTALTSLACFDNSLTTLNVANGNNSSFVSFFANNNPNLTCITVDNVTYSTTTWTQIDAQTSFSTNCGAPCTVTIPDANFKAYLVGNSAINTNGNTEIECSEATAFTGGIFANSLSISDLTGVEAFTSLAGLHCTNNSITTIDISANTLLQGLKCSDNQITSISTVNNPLLSLLYCHNNLFTGLDLTTNPSLQYVHCYNNLISTMSLPQSATLEEISAGDNNLTAIDVSFNTGLKLLELDQNQISTIDLSQNTLLEKLYVRNNLFTSLDCSNNSSLNWIVINDNPNMQTFDISHGNNTIISFFWAHNSPNLTCIQVDDVAYSTANWTNSNFNFDAASSFSVNCNPPCTVTIPDANFKAYLVGNSAINTNGNTEIECSEASAFTGSINCPNLSISDLTGIEAFTALTELYCSRNSLTSLDVTQNTALTDLSCGANALSSLDVTQNTALTLLYCQVNSISSLDVTQNTTLTKLFCQGNSLSSLDVTQNTALTRLLCGGSSLTSLDVSNNTSLTELDCGSSLLSSLDVTQNTVLTKLYCNQNSLTTLNVANGNNSNFVSFFANNNPNLTCITVDNVAYSTTNWTIIDAGASFSTNCSGTVGIDELSNESLSIYPNPATNQLTIDNGNLIITYISIVDITGKTVKTINGNVSTINVTDLTKGIYFLQVQTENGLLNSKFIKE